MPELHALEPNGDVSFRISLMRLKSSSDGVRTTVVPITTKAPSRPSRIALSGTASKWRSDLYGLRMPAVRPLRA